MSQQQLHEVAKWFCKSFEKKSVNNCCDSLAVGKAYRARQSRKGYQQDIVEFLKEFLILYLAAHTPYTQ